MNARWLSIPAVALLILSAGRAPADSQASHAGAGSSGASAAEPIPAAPASIGMAFDAPDVLSRAGSQDPEALAQRNRCLECHGQRPTDPTFDQIAARYSGVENARAALIRTVRDGGKGNWPEARDLVMPPYSGRLSTSEIELLVDWVLAHGR